MSPTYFIRLLWIFFIIFNIIAKCDPKDNNKTAKWYQPSSLLWTLDIIDVITEQYTIIIQKGLH